MSYLCTACEERDIPHDEPPGGWAGHGRAEALYCTSCHELTCHVPGPRGYVERDG